MNDFLEARRAFMELGQEGMKEYKKVRHHTLNYKYYKTCGKQFNNQIKFQEKKTF